MRKAFINQFQRIEVNPAVMLGKPVVRGTRITVALILNLLAHGYTAERILQAYPDLTQADVQAATAYASAITNRELKEYA